MDPRAILLAQNIIKGRIMYTNAITSRPDLKEDIDAYLTQEGYAHLIVT